MDMMQFQRQTTQLAMTQRMQESLRILQMSNADLGDYLAAQALENPCLEVRVPEGASVAPPLPSRGIQAAVDRDAFATVEGQPPSLLAHVEAQIDLAFFDPGDRRIALAFAEALEPSGWLGAPVAEVAAAAGVEEDEARVILERLQAFEPAGLFARSLAECLALQLADLGLLTWELRTMLDHLHLVAEGKLADLARRCDCEIEHVRENLALIRSLKPKPGEAFAQDRTPIQPPDVRVLRGEDGWEVELTRAQLPRITVAEAGSTGDAATDAWLTRAQSQARWLMRAVERRQATLLRTAACLVRHQSAFLEQGPRALKPLSMEEVALELELHPSTISRATATRLIETPRGLVPLRSFFSRSVASDGPAAPQSQDALMALVGEIVAREDRSRPLSDDAIVKQAKLMGAVLARRTVTKYREALGIPSSYDRKRAGAAA
ncbi:RNA polymerase factor sigma-54 [Cereibacter azotoformans]|uniref:RNA polymerase sigma-54 factor n=1 Tax=Cereibacter azotoformans TaxID=43057 RepID=A0A2T5K8Z5_9RHOB|nr:RNA polymerase factor sigma-54 [Cereibacter azotoformans]AXQ93398.1 RNA polymerase sigma-54 factor [Cereibacter sphaeroides]MBO4168928.1 RNA polymerase factor sigma-54 [Cereibacter azotoformans]PTR18859.1 RNA polymerase RpoN-/SigL-like sigma 54 subunit [Cereibacter azotoformans]UIJ31723.1 RNA polymerase factor sigma-54 [Cereibacter azotoformans]